MARRQPHGGVPGRCAEIPSDALYYQGGTSFRFGPNAPDSTTKLVFDAQHSPLTASIYTSGIFEHLIMPNGAGDKQ